MADLAAAQHGVVTRRQLLDLGLSPSAISRRLADGSLHRLHDGVYAVGHLALTPKARMLAAVLACGPGAVLSHRSAALVWDLRVAATPIADVTVPRGRRARPGIRVRRSRTLLPCDVTDHDGFPVTTVTRTLFDLAGVLPAPRFERTWETADRNRLLDLIGLEELCERAGRGRNGASRVRTLIATATEPPPTREELERRFALLCRQHRLPPPGHNASVAGVEVDAVWESAKLVVELDSFAFHRTRQAFENDHERDAALARAGYRVLRFTWRQVTREPAVVAETIARALKLRS